MGELVVISIIEIKFRNPILVGVNERRKELTGECNSSAKAYMIALNVSKEGGGVPLIKQQTLCDSAPAL